MREEEEKRLAAEEEEKKRKAQEEEEEKKKAKPAKRQLTWPIYKKKEDLKKLAKMKNRYPRFVTWDEFQQVRRERFHVMTQCPVGIWKPSDSPSFRN